MLHTSSRVPRTVGVNQPRQASPLWALQETRSSWALRGLQNRKRRSDEANAFAMLILVYPGNSCQAGFASFSSLWGCRGCLGTTAGTNKEAESHEGGICNGLHGWILAALLPFRLQPPRCCLVNAAKRAARHPGRWGGPGCGQGEVTSPFTGAEQSWWQLCELLPCPYWGVCKAPASGVM